MLLSSPFCEKYKYFEVFLLPFSWSLDSTTLHKLFTHVEKLSIRLPVWIVTSKRWFVWELKEIISPKVIGSEIVLQNIILPEHIFDSFFSFFNLNVFLLILWFHSLFIYQKAVRDFVFDEALFLWFGTGIGLVETSMFGVTHVSVRRGFGSRLDDNSFGFVLFVFFDVGCLDGEISTFFTFSFVLFAACVNLANQLFVELQVWLALVFIVIFVFPNRNTEHFVLNIWVKLKITSTLKRDFFGTVGFFLETLLGGLDKFIDDVDIDLAEFPSKIVVNDFIEFSEYFSQFGVKMILDANVWPMISGRVTCRGDGVQYWPTYCRFNREVVWVTSLTPLSILSWWPNCQYGSRISIHQ